MLIRIKMHRMGTGSETCATQVGGGKTAFKGISRKYPRFLFGVFFLVLARLIS